MNLKDRQLSEKNISGQSRSPESLTDTMPISRQPSREQELLSRAQDTIRELTEAVSSLQGQLETEKSRTREAMEKISTLSSQNSMLLSGAQEMRSTMEQLREELSSEQSLNQRIAKENDDLRNGQGLQTRESQDRLQRENAALKGENDELREQVDLSNVEAVASAQRSKEDLEKNYKTLIGLIDKNNRQKMANAEKKMREIGNKNKQLLTRQRDMDFATFMTELLSLTCCCALNPVFPSDLWVFIAKPFIWIRGGSCFYAEWLMNPFYCNLLENSEIQYFSPGWGWAFRILSVILVPALCFAMVSAVVALAHFWKKEWCGLSTRIAYCTLTILVGTALYQVTSLNIILIFFIVNLLGLVMIMLIDVRLQNDRRRRKWLYIKSLAPFETCYKN